MLGGENGVRALVDRFYDAMDTVSEYWGIRKLHPASLQGSRDKFFMYLSGWLGGPPLYVEAFGHPFLRARHLPFSIGNDERDQWLACMRQALGGSNADPAFLERLFEAFTQTANHMRNREG
ncbi:MAG: globin [Betaproteobacteria bacterium]|nr:globin [Betaproteobacteria bacterium]